jgi:hypothetical protein
LGGLTREETNDPRNCRRAGAAIIATGVILAIVAGVFVAMFLL